MSLRDLAMAALSQKSGSHSIEGNCPSGTTLGMSQWDGMKNHISGTSGTIGTHGTHGTTGTVATVFAGECRALGLDETISERTAIALDMGEVPPVYADAFSRLQVQSLFGIPPDWQAQAAGMAGRLLNRHGAELARLAWPVGAIFGSPLVLAMAGESAALDLRKAGLAWHIKPGDRLVSITASSVTVIAPDGRQSKQERAAHGPE